MDLLPRLPLAGPSQMAEGEETGAGIYTHQRTEAWGREKRGGEHIWTDPTPWVVHLTPTFKGVRMKEVDMWKLLEHTNC